MADQLFEIPKDLSVLQCGREIEFYFVPVSMYLVYKSASSAAAEYTPHVFSRLSESLWLLSEAVTPAGAPQGPHPVSWRRVGRRDGGGEKSDTVRFPPFDFTVRFSEFCTACLVRNLFL